MEGGTEQTGRKKGRTAKEGRKERRKASNKKGVPGKKINIRKCLGRKDRMQ